jgi:hypothetical protein
LLRASGLRDRSVERRVNSEISELSVNVLDGRKFSGTEREMHRRPATDHSIRRVPALRGLEFFEALLFLWSKGDIQHRLQTLEFDPTVIRAFVDLVECICELDRTAELVHR